MDPRLRFFISNNWLWKLNITTAKLTAYLHQTGTPHDAMLAKTLMHHHNQSIFQHFLHHIPEKLFVGKSVLYLFLYLLKATEILFQFSIKFFNKFMNHNPENLLVVTKNYIFIHFSLLRQRSFGPTSVSDVSANQVA